MQKLITDDQLHEAKLLSSKSVKLLWLAFLCEEWSWGKRDRFLTMTD